MPTYRFVAQNEAMLEAFKRIYGRNWVYIKSPLPQLMKLRGLSGVHLVVWLDMDALAPDEFYRLVMHIAAEFEEQPIGVSVGLTQGGLPLMAANGLIVIENLLEPPEGYDGTSD